MSVHKRAEDYVYAEWRRQARLALSHNAAESRAARAMVDVLQRVLEDMSDYGRSLVWGYEGRKRSG